MLTEIKRDNFNNNFNKLNKLNHNINKFNSLINTNKFNSVEYIINNKYKISKNNYVELNDISQTIELTSNLNLDINKYNNNNFFIKYKQSIINQIKTNNYHRFINYDSINNDTFLDLNEKHNSLDSNFFNINKRVLEQFNNDIKRFSKDIYVIIDNKYYLFNIKQINNIYGDKIEIDEDKYINKINTKINIIINNIFKIKEFDVKTKNIIKNYFITLINQNIRNEFASEYYNIVYGAGFEIIGGINNIISVIDCDNLIAFQLFDFKSSPQSKYQPLVNLINKNVKSYTCEEDNICRYICVIIKINSQNEPEFIIFHYFNKAISHTFDKDLILETVKLISFVNI
jgi:hypothetical protein